MFHSKGPTLRELVRQGLSSTERGYDLLAPKFDYTPFRTPEPVLDVAIERIGGPGSIDTALDVCCGTGAATYRLEPLCRTSAVGIDVSAGMIEVARRRARSAEVESRVEFVRGDVLSMPFENVFDVAVCFGAFGHILRKDEPAFVAQIARALRPGGRFVFATTTMPSFASPAWWLSRTFNGVMRARNLLIRPPFVMYYLTFLLPGVVQILERQGFRVEVDSSAYRGPWQPLRLVIATLDPGRT